MYMYARVCASCGKGGSVASFSLVIKFAEAQGLKLQHRHSSENDLLHIKCADHLERLAKHKEVEKRKKASKQGVSTGKTTAKNPL